MDELSSNDDGWCNCIGQLLLIQRRSLDTYAMLATDPQINGDLCLISVQKYKKIARVLSVNVGNPLISIIIWLWSWLIRKKVLRRLSSPGHWRVKVEDFYIYFNASLSVTVVMLLNIWAEWWNAFPLHIILKSKRLRCFSLNVSIAWFSARHP